MLIGLNEILRLLNELLMQITILKAQFFVRNRQT